MPLGPGARLGSYEIISAIGAGGMGEVYRARDTRLKREVALKILPASFAGDPDRLARFQREAEVLASLNHPNIAAIYGVEEGPAEAGPHVRALVMELVEGETLADRIARGAIPVDEALPMAKQIAEALEAAHEQGIIHRDLKPANIKLRRDGTVKVLDFGLAKLAEAGEAGRAGKDALSLSPTITSPALMTGVGVLLGTAAYMAPEQVRGNIVDKRADIWAFGCVLYELLTGRRAFEGDTVTDTLASILKGEPEWMRLPGATPPPVATLLRRCLRKDMRQRMTDAGAVRIEMADAIAGVSSGTRPPNDRRSFKVLIAAAVITLVLLLSGMAIDVWLRMRPTATAREGVLHLAVPVPAGAEVDEPGLALSPDGTQLAYVGSRGGSQLYLRSLARENAVVLPGTDGALDPFFSPDGKWIGFTAAGKLKKISTSGGIAITLADSGAQGGSWGPNDTIVFRASNDLGLLEIPASGGTPRRIPTPDPADATRPLQQPEFLPGGAVVLFASPDADTATADEKTIGALVLKTGERKVLIQGGSHPHFVPTGHLLFMRSGTLLAAPFDLERLEVTGQPVSVLQNVREGVTGRGSFACSFTGTCAFVLGGMSSSQRQVALADRTGRLQLLSLPRQSYGHPRFSPAGDKVSFWIEQVNCDAVVYDLARGTLTRATGDGDDHFPVWTPDGRKLTFISRKIATSPFYDVFSKPVDGSGPEERLPGNSLRLGPLAWLSWSPDSQVLAYVDRGDIWLRSGSGDVTAHPFLQSKFNEMMPAFSPDGRWLAYVSNETGRDDVYVQRFPGPGPRFPVAAGTEPVWARNGRELFFRDGDRLMSVQITLQPGFSAGTPRSLFVAPSVRGSASRATYDVSPDGLHIVLVSEGGQQQYVSDINVVLNWYDELKRLAPTQ